MKNHFKTAILAPALLASACGGSGPAGDFTASLPPPPPEVAPAANGAIFQTASGYAPLILGNRARAVGDPLTIMLIENTRTSKSAGSDTKREGGFGIDPPATGPLAFIEPDSLKASAEGSFKGSGTANQASTLSGELSVTIADVRPNGTALVRGEKRLMLSQGEEWVQFSGIVRLTDLDADNRIASSRVADARIVYAGKGAVQTASREGWLSKFFNMITPF